MPKAPTVPNSDRRTIDGKTGQERNGNPNGAAQGCAALEPGQIDFQEGSKRLSSGVTHMERRTHDCQSESAIWSSPAGNSGSPARSTFRPVVCSASPMQANRPLRTPNVPRASSLGGENPAADATTGPGGLASE